MTSISKPARIGRVKWKRIHPAALQGWAQAPVNPYQMAKPLPGVLPAGKNEMALDAAPGVQQLYSYAAALNSVGDLSFPGFPLLAELAQRPEYRHISDTLAREMTREWCELVAKSDEDKQDKIGRLTDLMREHRLQDKFRVAATHDGLFGRGHVFVDVEDSWRDNAVLGAKLSRTPAGIKKGAKIAFRNVEPIWTYPNDYNSDNPLDPDFYNPRTWFVMGKSVHRSRLLTFVGRPLPDLLKPAYGFAGLSMSQMALPYVQNWLRTRQSVSDLLHSFSVMVLKTNMGAVLQSDGGDTLLQRAQLFNLARDNRGLMMVDRDTEDLANVSAPIAGLDKLQAQAQEQMASVSTIPLVKLLGVTPSGLNASSDGEIRVFYDTIAAMQEAIFTSNLVACLDVLQLAEFGEIDPDISAQWVALWQLDEAAKAAIRKTNADTMLELIEGGVLSPEEGRENLANDPDSGYSNIDASALPEAPEGEGEPLNDPETNRVDERAENQGGETSGV